MRLRKDKPRSTLSSTAASCSDWARAGDVRMSKRPPARSNVRNAPCFHLIVGVGSFNPEPTATAVEAWSAGTFAVAVGSGLNDAAGDDAVVLVVSSSSFSAPTRWQ